MALIKKLQWKGFEPEYWFVCEITPNFKTKKTVIGLGLYKSKQVRDLDKQANNLNNSIGRQNIDMSLHTFTVDGVGLSMEDCYKLVKTHSINTFFNDAIDDIQATDNPIIPETGTWLPANSKWNYNGTTVQVKVGHFRTADNPTTTPSLFSVVGSSTTTSAWIANEYVLLGTQRTHGGVTYKCIQPHTTQTGWEPNITPALWVVVASNNVWAAGISVVLNSVWIYEPNGLSYKCLQPHTTQIGWEPPNVPALWQLTT